MADLKTAMQQAGMQTLDARLRAVLTDALIGNPGSMTLAIDAALREIEMRAPELAWPLHAGVHHRRAVAGRMETLRFEMAEAERATRKADAGGGEGHAGTDDHSSPALPTTTQAPRGASRAGQSNLDGQSKIARPALSPAMSAASRRAQSGVAMRGLLATVIVNGQPLALVLPEEARAAGRAKIVAAKGDAAEGRFLLAIAANLPPDDPIGRWRTAEDAEAVMTQARAWAGERMANVED